MPSHFHMKITPIEHGLDLAKNLGGKRSEGVHMSDLYGSLYAAIEPKRYAKKKDAPPPKERWMIGMAFEEILEVGLKNRVGKVAEDETITRPGEFETAHTSRCPRTRDNRPYGCGCVCGGGILYTPDLLIFNGTSRVGEIKFHSMSHTDIKLPKAGKSLDALPPKFDKFFTQLMVYCYHVGTTSGRLYMFSAREMVHFNEDRIFMPFDVEFQEHELVETWEWVLNHSVQEGLLRAA